VSEGAHVLYKATAAYDSKAERTIQWDDPVLGIDWQITEPPTTSARDSVGTPFREAEVFE
jgi:dTDP-4-dehydrorhamnose 3,5-epimerase